MNNCPVCGKEFKFSQNPYHKIKVGTKIVIFQDTKSSLTEEFLNKELIVTECLSLETDEYTQRISLRLEGINHSFDQLGWNIHPDDFRIV